jgi:hypothetical protein
MPGPNAKQRALLDEFQTKALDLYAPEISRTSVGMLVYHDDAPSVNGTGVLLQIGDLRLLVSAAHVLDFMSIHKIPYMLSPSGYDEPFVPISPWRSWSSPIPVGRDPKDPLMREDDPLDIGYVELPPDVVERIGRRYRYASLSEIDVSEDLMPGYYLVHGFPRFLSATDKPSRLLVVEPMPYLTLLSDDKDEGFMPGREIRIQYPELGINPQREDQHMPSPRGISGCGIWRIARFTLPEQWRREDVKLVGIEHTFRQQNESRYLQGTRIRLGLEMIYRTYPMVRKIMDLHLGLLTQGW